MARYVVIRFKIINYQMVPKGGGRGGADGEGVLVCGG